MPTYSSPVIITDVIVSRTKSGGSWNSSSGSYPTQVATNYLDRNSNPNYRVLIAKGNNATNPYTRIRYEITPGYYSMWTKQTGGSQEGMYFRTIGCQSPSPIPSFSWLGLSVENEASSRLKRKLREVTGSSNQLTNLVELRELPRTIVGAANSALGLIHSVTTSKKKGKDLKKYASESWLNWSFGIKPTLGAIDDLIQSIDAYKNRKDLSLRDYGISSDSLPVRTAALSSGSFGFQAKLTGQFTAERSCKLTTGYRMNLKSDESYTMAKHLGFDISNVIPTAYELLPFSWLFDYFTTAGDYLEDTFYVQPGNMIYLCQSIRHTIEGKIDAMPVQLASGYDLLDWRTSPCKVKMTNFTRVPLQALPRSPFRLKTSKEIGFNAVTKLLNLTSILGSK